jgi:2-methylcitrate dehydratase
MTTDFDPTITTIAEYVASLGEHDLPPHASDRLVLHHLDSIGCALGALGSPVTDAILSIAASATCDQGASAITVGARTTAEYGALANGALIRYLDYNDNYLANGGGHTSDIIGAVFAAAEQADRSGKAFLVALHAGYEVFASLADAVPLRDCGWDYPYFIGIASAAAAAKALGLSAPCIANAVAMTVTASLPLGITRVGPLANWKGLAAPFAAMNGLTAARLASLGITGPPNAIEGHRGLWALGTGRFDLSALGEPVGGLTAIERTGCKLYVAEYNAQGPVDWFVGLHDEGVRADDVESVRIRTYEVAWSEIGGGQDDHAIKWDPQNKETADHSLPYMVAVALTDGDVTADSYAPARVRDQTLRPLMQRIEVEPDDDITRRWTDEPAHDITVRLRGGDERHVYISHPKGHFRNPASEAEVLRKFRRQAAPALGDELSERLLDELRCIREVPSVRAVADQYREFATAPRSNG